MVVTCEGASAKRQDEPIRNASWDDTGPMSPYTSPSMSSSAIPSTSLAPGRPDCIGIRLGALMSLLGMAIAMVMNRVGEAKFCHDDYESRSSFGSSVLLRLSKESLFRLCSLLPSTPRSYATGYKAGDLLCPTTLGLLSLHERTE